MKMHKSIVGIAEKNGTLSGLGCWTPENNTILTCYHLIKDKTLITIITHTGEKKPVTISHAHSIPELDIAIIEMNFEPEEYIIPTVHYELNEAVFIPPSYERRITQLTGALKLNIPLPDNSIDGAPVMLKRNGQVIGIVNKQYSIDEIIPFNTLALQSQKFETVLNTWSSHLETAQQKKLETTAQTAMEKHVKSMLYTLIDKRYFFPQYYFDRKNISAAINTYLTSNQQLFTIIGKAGSGKTFILANFLYKHKHQHNLFFFSLHNFECNFQGIEELLYYELKKFVDAPDLLTTYNHIQTKEPLTIIIDGIDDIFTSPLEITTWLTSAMHWANKGQHKLIISCSSNMWSNYIPVTLSNSERLSLIELTPFTLLEQEQTRLLYQHAKVYGKEGIFSDPFTFHLVCTFFFYPNEKRKTKFTYLHVFRKSITSLMDRIEKDQKTRDHRTVVIFEEIGKVIFETGSYYIDPNYFQTLREDYQDCLNSLLANHFLVSTPRGLRVKHKSIANYLSGFAYHDQLRKFSLPALGDDMSEIIEETLLWHFTYESSSMRIHHWPELAEMIKLHPTNKKLINIFIRAMECAYKPEEHYSSIEKFLATLISNNILDEECLPPLFPLAKLSFPNQIGLIKIALTTDEKWDWENIPHETYLQKYFPEKSAPTFRSILLHHLTTQKTTVLPLIATWLHDDHTNHIACSILYHFSDNQVELVFDLLANYFSPKEDPFNDDDALKTLTHLANKDHEMTFRIIHTWKQQNQHTLLVIHLATFLANQNIAFFETTELLLARILQQTTIIKEKVACIEYFIQLPAYETAMIYEILDLLQSELLTTNIADLLHNYIEKYYDTIYPVLLQYVKIGQNNDRVHECCTLLRPNRQSLIELQQFIQDIAHFLSTHPNQVCRMEGLLIPYLQAAPYGTSSYHTVKEWLLEILTTNDKIPDELISYLCSQHEDYLKWQDNQDTIKELLNINPNLREALYISLIENTIFLTDQQIFEIISPTLVISYVDDRDLYDSITNKCMTSRPALHTLIQALPLPEPTAPPIEEQEIYEEVVLQESTLFQRVSSKYYDMLNRLCPPSNLY